MHIGIGIGLDKIRRAIAAIFSPSSLFANSEVGVWYDPSDVNVNWRRNLLTYTEEFDNTAWAKINVTITANATTAPDGNTTADLIIATAATSDHAVTNNTVIGLVDANFSVYVKAGNYNYVAIGQTYGSGGAFYKSIINLSTGEIESQQNSTEVTDVGNGWYRVSIQFLSTFSTSRSVKVSPQPTSTYQSSYTGDDTSGIYAWGAQLELGSTATAYQRIVTPEITYVADVQPQPILYQNNIGTTPVTAVEQPVGLMLDKSQGLVLGSELVTNGTFDTDTTGWTAINFGTLTWLDSAAKIESNGGNFGAFNQTLSAVVGKFYEITITAVETSGNAFRAYFSGVTLKNDTITGTFTYIVAATTTTPTIELRTGTPTAGAYTVWDNISVKELPGNHASQSTNASRPTLSARYNLLTYSEQFDNSAWGSRPGATVSANATTAPDGTTTADTLTATAGSQRHLTQQNITSSASSQHTHSVYLKYINNQFVSVQDYDSSYKGCIFDIQNGTVGSNSTGVVGSIESVGNGWYKCSITFTNANTTKYLAIQLQPSDSAANIGALWTAVGGEEVYIWGADLRVTNDGVNLPAYQRVAAATDYDTVGFPTYLKFDGVDDSMVTNSIDFTGTDKMTVWTGVRKLSDASLGIYAELSTSIANNQTFNVSVPQLSSNKFAFASRGTTQVSATTTSATYNAPITTVLTGTASISEDSVILRLNKTEVGSNTADQGAGNYGNYPLYIGSRAGTSFRFNGRMYSLIVRGAESTATEITDTEDWVNNVTKAY